MEDVELPRRIVAVAISEAGLGAGCPAGLLAAGGFNFVFLFAIMSEAFGACFLLGLAELLLSMIERILLMRSFT